LEAQIAGETGGFLAVDKRSGYVQIARIQFGICCSAKSGHNYRVRFTSRYFIACPQGGASADSRNMQRDFSHADPANYALDSP
jgi:hypothetical protein